MQPDTLIDVPAIAQFGKDSGIFGMMNSKWGWPISEIIHFTGLCMIMLAIGMFDLRLLGLARGLPIAVLHRLIPVGVAGFALCVITGFLFFVSAPDQYLYNPAFQTKMMLMALAGANMVLFYSTTAAAAKATKPYDDPLLRARVIAFVSLACWLGVIACGRLITFFRPPYHWCFWC
jgi:hypothetical protein